MPALAVVAAPLTPRQVCLASGGRRSRRELWMRCLMWWRRGPAGRGRLACWSPPSLLPTASAGSPRGASHGHALPVSCNVQLNSFKIRVAAPAEDPAARPQRGESVVIRAGHPVCTDQLAVVGGISLCQQNLKFTWPLSSGMHVRVPMQKLGKQLEREAVYTQENTGKTRQHQGQGAIGR